MKLKWYRGFNLAIFVSILILFVLPIAFLYSSSKNPDTLNKALENYQKLIWSILGISLFFFIVYFTTQFLVYSKLKKNILFKNLSLISLIYLITLIISCIIWVIFRYQISKVGIVELTIVSTILLFINIFLGITITVLNILLSNRVVKLITFSDLFDPQFKLNTKNQPITSIDDDIVKIKLKDLKNIKYFKVDKSSFDVTSEFIRKERNNSDTFKNKNNYSNNKFLLKMLKKITIKPFSNLNASNKTKTNKKK